MRDLDAMKSEWVTVGGTRMHARSPKTPPAASSAPVVVLVHGIGVSSRYMAPLAVRLAPRFRVLAPDLPGFGLGDKPKEPLGLDALADALASWHRAMRLPRAAFVANSFGCQILVRLALRHRDVIARMVLQGPTTDPDASVPRQIARWLAAGSREPFDLNGVILADYAECGLRRLVATYAEAVRDPIRAELPRVRVPTLVVRGARDRIATESWAEEVARAIPGARLVVVPGAAHAMNYGSPEAFADAITPFLLEEDARATGTVDRRL